MKRVLALTLLTLLILGTVGCTFLDTIGVDLAVTNFTGGWQNREASLFEKVFADTVTINGSAFLKANAINYFVNNNWWTGYEHGSFVAWTPDFPDSDHATTTIDFEVTETSTSYVYQVHVTLGLTRLQGQKWLIHTVTFAPNWLL